MGRYTIRKAVPCSGKKYAEYLATLLAIYSKDRAKEVARAEKALRKLDTKINRIEKQLREMGDDVFCEEIKEI